MLSTIEKVKSYIGIPLSDTSKDAKIETALKGVSKWIERKTSRTFGYDEYVETLSGDEDMEELQLRHFPVDPDASLTLKIDGVTIDLDAEMTAKKAMIDYDAGVIIRDRGFRRGLKNVEVTYSAGYVLPDAEDEDGSLSAQTLPEDLELAAIRLTARLIERSTAEGLARASSGSLSMDFEAEIQEDVKETLDSYARIVM